MVLDLSKLNKNKDLDHIRSTPNAKFTPRPKSMRKLGGKTPTIRKPKHFEKARQQLRDTGELSLDHFSNAAEIGAFIDWHNQTVKNKKEKEAGRDILEISKLLARLATQKTFIM